jgi:hypothetical protein
MTEFMSWGTKICLTLSALGGGLAMMMIVWAGVMDIVGNGQWKAQAKELKESVIRGCITIIVGPWIIKILWTILKGIFPSMPSF